MALEALPPDARDILEVMAPTLTPCPFCGGRPVTHQAVNPTPTFGRGSIYRSVVSCTGEGCGAAIGYNAYVLEDARAEAARRWNRRTPGGARTPPVREGA